MNTQERMYNMCKKINMMALGVTNVIKMRIEETEEARVTINDKMYYVWCGKLYGSYGKFGYADEVEMYSIHKECIGDYSFVMTDDAIVIYYKGVNTLESIDVSDIPWVAKEVVLSGVLAKFTKGEA